MAKGTGPTTELNSQKLDRIANLIQDLFILQAAETGLKKEAVRKILGVGMSRVTRIWRHVEKKKEGSK